MFPGFLGIGAQKAGSTWLHSMLSMHDEIWLPHLKELHYFDRKFPIKPINNMPAVRPARGILARQVTARLRRIDARKLLERLSIKRWRDLTWEFRYLFGDWNDEWYASLFNDARERLAGEITPAYSCLSDAAISHVQALMPDAKLILLLRDPIDRAWSHARMDLARNAGRAAEEISDAEYLAHFNGTASRIRGDYPGTIRRWRAHFPEKQFFVGFYDEILSSPEQLLLRIFKYLGVSATEQSLPDKIRVKVNVGQQAPIPQQLHKHLAALYIDDLRGLAKDYGNYPKRWLERGERVLSGTTNR